MFEGFERHTLDAGDVAINCVTGGSGPPVLLLHGYPQTHAMWARIAPRLARSHTVVCTDLRGYGDSSKPRCLDDRSNYSFRAMAADQVEAMRLLGHDRFHVFGHDRGGRTAHRLALDHPERALSLAVLDIVPTYAMFMETNRHVSGGYWHWYFLALPEPFPETLIGHDPDFYFQTSMFGWGRMSEDDFDREQFDEYRRCWRDPEMIHGSCSDYRAAAGIDLEHDTADIDRKVACPTLVFWGEHGLMHQMFDMEAQWLKRCEKVRTATLPGGHFFPDHFPDETAAALLDFLQSQG